MQYAQRVITSKDGCKKDNIKYIIISLMSFGILVRLIVMCTHFTHVDDNGAMNYLMYFKMIGKTPLRAAWNFCTYAPLQILFSAFMLNYNNSHMVNLILGRLPSCLAGIAVIVVFWRLIKNDICSHDIDERILLLPLSVCVFSWENIIYSSQAEPYEIVVLVGLIAYGLIQFDFFKEWKSCLIIIVILTACCYSHYQSFIIVFSLYVTLFVLNIRKKDRVIKLFVVGASNFVLTLPLLFMMKDSGMFEKSINWNPGIDGSFWFHLDQGSTIERIVYIIKFFIRNYYLIIRYFMTVEDFSILGVVISVLFIILIAIGFIYIHKVNISMAIFLDAFLIINLVMIIMGKLTMGPSRHSLYMFPFLLILLTYGVAWMNNNIKTFRVAVYCTLLSVLLAGMFIVTFPSEFAQRRNYISEKMLNEICEKYNPDFIYSCGYVTDLFGMDISGYSEHINEASGHAYASSWFDMDNQNNRSGTFMIISRNTTDDEFTRESFGYKDVFLQNVLERGYRDVADMYPNYSVVYKKEIDSGEEVEYASKYYKNWGNGLYIYIFGYR